VGGGGTVLSYGIIEVISKNKNMSLDWFVKNKETKNTHYNKNNTCK
jgi:hypothetical protein